MALSCKLSLARFSAELKFQDRAECGNNDNQDKLFCACLQSYFSLLRLLIWKVGSNNEKNSIIVEDDLAKYASYYQW